MEQVSEILKNNKTEDINWFCSLSESELDLAISLKKLAIQRAKTCGHQELALVFDLSMLRSLGLVLMEYLRKRVHDDASLVPISNKVLDNCNLLHTHDDNDTIDIEEILTEICCNSQSRKKSRKSGSIKNGFEKKKGKAIGIFIDPYSSDIFVIVEAMVQV
ncbi:unnamed protein product [Cochlearia groenlandica]